MNILSKISIKNLSLNKKRTVSTIIGIILSVALICAVATMFTSFKETLVQNTIKDTGYWHFQISDISKSDIEELENSKYINDLNKVKIAGYSFLDGSKNQYKPYLKVISMDKKTFNNLGMNLVSGRMPENSSEIVISSHILNNAKVNLKIGDTLELSVGDRMTEDGYKLYPSNHYGNDDDIKELLVNKKQMKVTVVGIISRPNTGFELYSDPRLYCNYNRFRLWRYLCIC